MAKQPKIRFKGFSDEWENTSFKEIVTPVPYKQYIKIPELNGKYPIIQQGDNPILGYANGNPIMAFRNMVVFGDHTVSVFKPKTPFFVATDGIRIFNIEQFSQPFTFSLFEMYKPKQLGYTRHTLALYESIAYFPSSSNEQLCIGEFFDTFDVIISQREKELEKLKNIKRALLERMFPQDGQTTPAIRFNGFTDEWEEKNIGDAFKERDERSGDGELLSVTINSGIRRAIEMERTFATGDLNKYKVVKVGDIAYNTMRMWQGACGVSQYSGIVSPAYTIAMPQKNQDSVFYAYYFKTNLLLHEFRINSQGLTSDTWNLKYPTFERIRLFVPIEDEQRKIGSLFAKIDNLLFLRERQLTLLKHTKQALLEQMFVNE